MKDPCESERKSLSLNRRELLALSAAGGALAQIGEVSGQRVVFAGPRRDQPHLDGISGWAY